MNGGKLGARVYAKHASRLFGHFRIQSLLSCTMTFFSVNMEIIFFRLFHAASAGLSERIYIKLLSEALFLLSHHLQLCVITLKKKTCALKKKFFLLKLIYNEVTDVRCLTNVL